MANSRSAEDAGGIAAGADGARAWLHAPQRAGDVDLLWWTKQLSGPPALELPTDRPRAGHLRVGASAPCPLPAELIGPLEALSRQDDVSPSLVLLAAYQVLLSRHSGQEVLLVGAAIAERDAESALLLGPSAEPLILRADLSGDPTFRELLWRVRAAAAEAREHAGPSVEELRELLDIEGHGGRAPLYSASFEMRGWPPGALLPHPAAASHPAGSSAVELGLELAWWGDELLGSFRYDAALFDPETIARLAGRYRTLLEAAVAQPDTRIGHLPLLTDAERARLLVDWNDTRAEIPACCVHQLIEAQAERRPDAAAVVFEDTVLTYAELDRSANRLAHHLKRLGVGPDVLVGVCLERSADLLVALLGIWKAGGAYLPLDPGYPAERLAFIAGDAGIAVLLTEAGLEERLPPLGVTRVTVEADGEAIAAESDERPAPAARPEHLAYVIYTSGSTGRPKGVQVPHRALVNLLTHMQREPGICERDTLLAVTTLCFDIAALELFLPLVSGARVVVLGRSRAADGRDLRRALAESGATLMQATPATWRMLLAAGWKGGPDLKVLCGGEALAADLARRLRDTCGSVWNLYGPTETTVWSTLQRVERLPADGSSVPIGRPIANTRLYVFDRHGQLAPIGVAGELGIGGLGVARGYRRRPELSAEKFVPDPFGAEPGALLYRTGDLVRRLADGSVAYLGRLDHQIKVRGFRVEPGEVEAALRRHPGVSDAVVVAREDASGASALVGYVVAAGAPEARELRGFLGSQLPDYMVPSALVFLDALPLTPNGKVDRRALPAPGDGGRAAACVDPPRDETQALLVRVWEEVLERAPIGIRDDFFEIGGHSLLAVRLVRRIEEQSGRALPVAAIFSAPTIEELAPVLRGAHELTEPHWPVLVPLQPRGSRPPFFFVSGAANHFGARLGPDQPVYRLQVQDLDREDLFTDVDAMAANCLASLRGLQPRGPYTLGGHCLGGVVALEIARRLIAQGEAVNLLVLVDVHTPGAARLRPDIGVLRRIGMRARYQVARTGELGFRVTLSRAVRALLTRYRHLVWELSLQLGLEIHDPRAANFAAGARYVPQPYPGRITLLQASDQPPWREIDPGGGWSRIAAMGVEVHCIPGHHTGLYREPSVALLADVLNDCLSRARGGD